MPLVNCSGNESNEVADLQEFKKVCPCGNYEFVTTIRPVNNQTVTSYEYDAYGGRELDSQPSTHLFPEVQIDKPQVQSLSRSKKTEDQAVGSAETVQLEKEVSFNSGDVEKNWKIYYYGTCRSLDCEKDERIHRYRIGLYHKLSSNPSRIPLKLPLMLAYKNMEDDVILHYRVKLNKDGWFLVHEGLHSIAYAKLSQLLYLFILAMIKKYPHKLTSHFLPL
ncbi:hypothetical protein M3Y94_01274900 [Aphelenchoides besseyi]|nr:hypothetical protein M3Y94_01274900 [Aphelenchoides besseyi]KAI6222670.1 hypothetical protein M3Y95_00918100 [Aphelenchoides besseyi]